MTVGELAEMFNSEKRMGVKLHVIKMKDWQRTDWYDETGLAWVNPSPNLRNLTEAVIYPGVSMVEGANVSVGRGTDTPIRVARRSMDRFTKSGRLFECAGYSGVRFVPVDFRPVSNTFADRVCHGVQIILIDRQALDSAELGVELAAALWRLGPNVFEIDKTLPLIGARWVLKEIEAGKDPRRIAYEWQGALQEFRSLRSKYMLYP